MDRFALSFSLGYPSQDEELRMIQQLGQGRDLNALQPCISLDEVMAIRADCAQVRLEASLEQYLLDLVRATRSHQEITLGVSPRGTVAFYRAIQALAYIEGRDFAIPDDAKQLAPYVLAHRLIPLGNQSPKQLISALLAETPIP